MDNSKEAKKKFNKFYKEKFSPLMESKGNEYIKKTKNKDFEAYLNHLVDLAEDILKKEGVKDCNSSCIPGHLLFQIKYDGYPFWFKIQVVKDGNYGLTILG